MLCFLWQSTSARFREPVRDLHKEGIQVFGAGCLWPAKRQLCCLERRWLLENRRFVALQSGRPLGNLTESLGLACRIGFRRGGGLCIRRRLTQPVRQLFFF